MQLLWQLAIRNWRIKPGRGILAAAVVLLAVGLVTFTGLLLMAAQRHFHHRLTAWLGGTDVRVRPLVAQAGRKIPAIMLANIAQLHGVAFCGGKTSAWARFSHGGHASLAKLEAISWPEMNRLDPLILSSGRLPADVRGGWGNRIVLDGGLAGSLHVRPATVINVITASKKAANLQLSGIVSRSAVKRFLQPPRGYISTRLFHRLFPASAGYSEIDIRLKRGVNKQLFIRALRKFAGPAVTIASAGNARAAFHKVRELFSRIRILVVVPIAAGSGLLILAIMVTGIADRVRYLGQLRCLGAGRGQLVGAVLLEAVLPAIAGIAMGIAGAAAAAVLLAGHFPTIFGAVALTPGALFWGIVTGILAAGIGVIVPLAQALRASPMAAVRIAAAGPLYRPIWPFLAFGAACVALQRLLWLIPSNRLAVVVYAVVGGPLLFAAAFAMGPVLAAWLEGFSRRLLRRIWRINGELLYGTWRRKPFRTGFLIVSMMFATAFLISMRSRGAGLIKSWEFPAHFPDAFVFSPVSPLSAKRLRQLPGKVAGIKAAGSLTAFWVAPAARRGNAAQATGNMLFIAAQPRRFMRMVGLRFLRGTPQTAEKLLAQGSGVLVATRLRRSAGKIPRHITLQTLYGPTTFKVAGVVYSRGMSLAAGYMRVGHIFHAMAGISILGTLRQSAKYFGIAGANMVLLTIKPGYKGMAVVIAVKSFLGRSSHPSFLSDMFNFKAMQLRGTSVRAMKRKLNAVVRRVMHALSLLAIAVFVAGGIASGLLIAADIRSRRHELGILYAVGASRWQILRLLLAEISLNVVLAVFIGMLTAIYITYMATQVDHRLMGFNSLLVISWAAAPIALAATAAAAFAGAALPLARMFRRPVCIRG